LGGTESHGIHLHISLIHYIPGILFNISTFDHRQFQMSREQLLGISAGFLNWVSCHGKDPSELATVVAKDVVVLTPFPGTTPDFAGLLAHQQKANVGSSDFKLTVKDAIADEAKSTVVHFLEVTGTHDGY